MKPRKVSSKRLASIAGEMLESFKESENNSYVSCLDYVMWSDIAALAASVLSQAEAPKRRAKKVRK